jgi:DNA-binding CsgD family transcriptional regulator
LALLLVALCSRQTEQKPAATKAGGAKQMTQLNQWLSYGYGPFTLTVRYGDLQTLNLAPQEPARGIAPSFNTALTGTAPLPASEELALSPRQRDVLELIVQGLPNKEIARRLNLAVGTVKIHVAVLFHKMNVTSRTAAAVAGARLLAAPDVHRRAAA